jgi:1,2-diacylglycerol 3-alpha-glucosyltransferase
MIYSTKTDILIIPPIKIAFLSAGLGTIYRGFEISSSAWHENVYGRKNITSRLFSGNTFKGSTKVWNCSRDGYIARFLRRFNLIKDGCRLEQLSFGFGFLIQLIFYKPDIIWLQEATLADVLLKFRKAFHLKYKILFCDGAPVGHQYAKRFDYLIFLHQYAYDDAIRDGIDPEKCCVIPHLIFEPKKQISRYESRRFFNINEDHFVVLCVAAWNKHHKRIDYLIEEMAKVKSDKVSLILCGQSEQETTSLKDLANRLKINVYWHTLSQEDLSKAYSASDLFVLPSLNEALGAVLIEAGMHGLPAICHPHQAGKFIFGEDYGGLVDLSQSNNLSKKIDYYKNNMNCQNEGLRIKTMLDERLNSKSLTSEFIKFITHISNAKKLS